MYQNFGLKLQILDQILTFWGINMGHMLKLSIIMQKGTSLDDSAHFEPLSVKIRQRVWSLRVPQK